MKLRVKIAAAAMFTGLAASAFANPMPVRGTITGNAGGILTISKTDGSEATLKLAQGATIIEVLPASLADVQPGSYIGTAALRQPDGTYRAMELQIFPPSMRGVGLGTRPWNLKPHSSMTNGTVGRLAQESGTVSSVGGAGNLKLSVDDGSGTKQVLVPAGVPVVTYAPGSEADLKPGAHVIFFPATANGNALTVSRISVGKDGLTPPM